ncbi:hypothetical protein [Geomicrobium sp. JCM 19039]|uniref:hypothetical protein n=1 Tax=Geomicrobium sp. JCM 19039 TaxID=1460636 RepID=UPI00045F2A44|nr:hypothetical protein [Geomicrobium sp. JCM 19039]GAK14580.1 hypothetical protein JCM19039_4514 [Geomicrobium sp. JCM 19039]
MRSGYGLFSLLVPAPFLFHYLEYHQITGFAALSIGVVLAILIGGVLAAQVDVKDLLKVVVLVTAVSVVLGAFFIPNDTGWFIPLERNTVLIGSSLLYMAAQSVVRLLIIKLL